MFIGDDYVCLIPQYRFASVHSHSMLHIFLSRQAIEVNSTNARVRGQFIFIDSGYEHEVQMEENDCLIYLVDPSSALSEQIRRRYLQSSGIISYPIDERIAEFRNHALDSGLDHDGSELFQCMDLKSARDFQDSKDERIQRVIQAVKSGSFLNLEVKEIASRVYLSESRLSHLFKAETGMNLKNYLLMNKLKAAFEALNVGMTITEAAQAARFFDAAHLCNLVKKTTGLNISEIFPR